MTKKLTAALLVVCMFFTFAMPIGFAENGGNTLPPDASSVAVSESVDTAVSSSVSMDTGSGEAGSASGSTSNVSNSETIKSNSCGAVDVPAASMCPCSTLDGTHEEGCPFYVAPVEPVLPEAPAHIGTCVDGCTGEGCECPCHELGLFERLMACETLDELFAIVDVTPEDELMALTDEENAEIEAKIAALEPEPLPPVVLEDCENESVISNIIYPAVNFDNVAPFGAPVEG